MSIVWSSFKNVLKTLANRTDKTECPFGQLESENQCKNAQYQALSPVQYTPYDANGARKLKVTGATQISPQKYTVNHVTYEESKTYGPLECTCTTGIPASDPSNLNSGICYTMTCVNNTLNGQLYIEVAGGTGAQLQYYDDLGNAVLNYGGLPGIVFGVVEVSIGDILDVTFGYDAEQIPTTGASAGITTKTPGNGGTGAFLGGSNGGGSASVFLNGSLILLAGGGGGAGRNASGGNAGCATPDSSNVNTGLTNNSKHPNPIQDANPGTTLFGYSQTPPSRFSVSYSGGGGSLYKHSIAADGSSGPMLSGADANNILCGGGGGGSGYYGGAYGSWNNIAKPNNLHGAGGGGSSYIGKQVFYGSNQNGLCQLGTLPSSNTNLVTVPSNYIVFGWPNTTQ